MKITLAFSFIIFVFLSCQPRVKKEPVVNQVKTEIKTEDKKKSTNAKFPKENGTWTDFLIENMIYPEEALEQNYSKAMTASFFVEVDGSLTFIKMWKEEDKLYEAEIRRVAQLMPKWIPATDEDGQPKQSRIGLTYPFYLSSAYIHPKKNPDPEKNIILRPKVRASFPGGKEALEKFIIEKRGYERGGDGYCSVLVVIEKDGSLTNLETVNAGGKVMKDSAIPIIEQMPKWIPATHKGKAVRSQEVISISF